MSNEQELKAARNDLALTLWYITECCKGPYLGRPTADGPFPPHINTEAKAMQMMLDHIKEVASTMLEGHSTPEWKRFTDMWNK